MTLTILPVSMGTIFSYFCVACIYLLFCYIALKIFKRSGIILALAIATIGVLQIRHWYQLEIVRVEKRLQLAERAPDVYTFLSGKFKQLDKSGDGQIDQAELAHYKSDCSCTLSTLNFVRDNIDQIGFVRQLNGTDSLGLAIDKDDLEALKENTLRGFD
jgi:hypothetical protein